MLGSGVFDLFHISHLKYIQHVHAHGDVVVIMVNGDERVRSIKSSARPIIPAVERAGIIEALRYVDYVFIVPNAVEPGPQGDPTVKELFSVIKPDVFVTANPSWRQLPHFDKTKLVIVPRHADARFGSTTDIIEHLAGRGPAP